MKLTAALVTPLIAKARKQVKQQLAEKEQEFAKREVICANPRRQSFKLWIPRSPKGSRPSEQRSGNLKQ
jgi:hypothetical protein